MTCRDLEEMGYSPGLALMNAFIGAYARRDMTSTGLIALLVPLLPPSDL